ncbi:MAG: hypothetical protein KIT87_28700 [Anaerolineae bacterium]|nr:hypothetical protein [Anaerolineae bacterium]
MDNRNLLTKILAGTGTLLVWFPILTPLVLAVVARLTRGRFLLDYLMPAELLPSFLVGGGLLIWAAGRTRARQRLIGWGFGLAIAALVGSQALAVMTGLASGTTEPTGWPGAIVLALLAAYIVLVVVVGVGGVLVWRDLLKGGPARRLEEAV